MKNNHGFNYRITIVSTRESFVIKTQDFYQMIIFNIIHIVINIVTK